MWRVSIYAGVLKRLARLSTHDRARLLKAIYALADDPFTHSEKLQGRPEWRLRVGNWRMLLRIDQETHTVYVIEAGPRGDVYK